MPGCTEKLSRADLAHAYWQQRSAPASRAQTAYKKGSPLCCFGCCDKGALAPVTIKHLSSVTWECLPSAMQQLLLSVPWNLLHLPHEIVALCAIRIGLEDGAGPNWFETVGQSSTYLAGPAEPV